MLSMGSLELLLRASVFTVVRRCQGRISGGVCLGWKAVAVDGCALGLQILDYMCSPSWGFAHVSFSFTDGLFQFNKKFLSFFKKKLQKEFCKPFFVTYQAS